MAVSKGDCGDTIAWHGLHGLLLAPEVSWQAPRLCAASDEIARPGYGRPVTAAEYMDTPATLRAKVRVLARLLRESNHTVVYTGAGISTASGTPDYASKARGSRAPHAGRTERGNRLEAQPTYSHHALAALARHGSVHGWLQQNHDRLAQKAGFPQVRLNEIHGAWGDNKNRVKMMDDSLRPDLCTWMEEWEQRAELVLAMGTSLCGMHADCVAEACARRAHAHACTRAHTSANSNTASSDNPGCLKYRPGEGSPFGGGLVIINLQATQLDTRCSLRIWGLLDNVMALLAREMQVAVPDKVCHARGQDWQSRHPGCRFNTPLRKAKK